MLQFLPLALMLHLIQISLAYSDPSTCPQLYNYLSHSCQSCPANTGVASDKAYCNCTGNYYKNPQAIGFKAADSCLLLNGSVSTGQIISLYDRAGTWDPQALSCVDSYPSPAKTECIPCGYRMTYSASLNKCVCKDSNYYIVGEACFSSNQTFTNTYSNSSIMYDLYNKAQVGCKENADTESCQILLSECARTQYNTNNQFCLLMLSAKSAGRDAAIPTYSITSDALNESLNIYASSVRGTNTSTVKNKLDFILFQYNRYGQLMDIKPLDNNIIPCLTTEEDVIEFQSFGLNLYKQCLKEDTKTSTNYAYDVYVLTAARAYAEVYTYFPSLLNNLYKRITLLSDYNSIKMIYTSVPPLSLPYINYSAQASPRILTSSQTETVNMTLAAPFIVFNIGILVIFIIDFYKYMKYNPDQTNDPYFVFKAILLFLIMSLKYWGVGLWIFLFGSTAYCFCFYKFQETVYLILPNVQQQWAQYYEPFATVFYVQFAFVFLSVITLFTFHLGTNTDYFLIDWEKQKNLSEFDIKLGNNRKEASVWRKVLVVNELFELTVNRVVNMEFVVLFGVLFLSGLDWINLAYQIPNTSNLQNDSSSVKNIVLAYFIVTFVLFIIAAVQYLLRYLVKTWWPMPHEDFVDLCAISNISVVIFDEALHGYYIHGMNPLGKAEGSLQYIESVFEKEARSYGKSRAFRNDDPEQTQTFEVIFPFEVRQAFQMKYKTRYLQKLVGRAYDPSVFSKPIPDMLDENDYKELEALQNDMVESFKYYLQGVKTSQFNVQERTFLQKLVSCPIDMELIGRLPVFFKDYWYEFKNVLLSGHEFLLIINLINMVNIFYIATQNAFLAVFIAMCVRRLVFVNLAECMIKRNISKNTLIDDKFFN